MNIRIHLISDDGSKYCLYGKCFYCNEDESVCGDVDHLLEGVVLFLVPGTIEKHRSPWQRTYKENQLAPWEESMDFCHSVKGRMSYTRILDLVDVAIFDFLIQNGDRHHYETREDRIVLIDNGKGFGHPSIDHIDILAPLYQCCVYVFRFTRCKSRCFGLSWAENGRSFIESSVR